MLEHLQNYSKYRVKTFHSRYMNSIYSIRVSSKYRYVVTCGCNTGIVFVNSISKKRKGGAISDI